MHWSDPTTLELLDLTVDRSISLPVLLLITYRPEFAPPWIGRSHVTMLTLNRLPRRQGAEMIAYMTGGKALPKEISDQIVDHTDGVHDPIISPGVFPRPRAVEFQVLQIRASPAMTHCRPASVPLDSE